MRVDVDPSGGFARLDEPALAALHRLADGRDADPDPGLLAPLASAGLDAALAPVAEPLARIRVMVAGPRVRLEHAAWLGERSVTWVLGLRPGEHQLMPDDPAFVTAALVRLTRLGLRPSSDASTDLTWDLAVTWAGGERRLGAADGPAGLRLLDPATGALRPASRTFAYRVLSTVLPTDADLEGGAGSAVAAPLQG